MSSQGPKYRVPKESNTAVAWFIGGFALLAVAIIGVSWYFIESLQDNSSKLRMYKISPQYDMPDTMSATSDKLLDSLGGVQDSKIGTTFDEGMALKNKGRYKEAIAAFTESLNLCQESLKGKEPNILEKNNILGRLEQITSCYMAMKQWQEALKWSNKCIECLNSKGSNYNIRGEIYYALGQTELADRDLDLGSRLKGSSPNKADMARDMMIHR